MLQRSCEKDLYDYLLMCLEEIDSCYSEQKHMKEQEWNSIPWFWFGETNEKLNPIKMCAF